MGAGGREQEAGERIKNYLFPLCSPLPAPLPLVCPMPNLLLLYFQSFV